MIGYAALVLTVGAVGAFSVVWFRERRSGRAAWAATALVIVGISLTWWLLPDSVSDSRTINFVFLGGMLIGFGSGFLVRKKGASDRR